MKDRRRIFLKWLIAAAIFPIGMEAQVTVTDTGSDITIGNTYLSRTLKLSSGKLSPGSIVNKRNSGGAVTFTPYTGSEEFIINTLVNGTTALIKASQLTYQSKAEDVITDGKRLTITFAPYAANNCTWTIKEIFEMKDNNPYMRKYLKINVPEAQRSIAGIDYIDMESLGTTGVTSGHSWSRPTQGDALGVPGVLVALGQPIYIEGMYLGSEFPETDNQIASNRAYVRYYSGKTFNKWNIEKRLDSEGNFTTWPNVLGATSSTTDYDIVRNEFYDYLHKEIARPAKFRLQYNSWYDWKQEITSSRVISSFKAMEKGFSQHGLHPIGSYAVDNGWNAYAYEGMEGGYDSKLTSINTGDFWQFNNKFPNGLTDASDYAHRVNSDFGLWISPRGGYTYQGPFAKFLESKGTGTYNKNSADIVTGDSVYISRMEKLCLEYQKAYNINYWKVDGILQKVPQASTNGRYITGGTNGMYYVTEHWERWDKVFDALYADAASRNTSLFVNLTSYVTPSPWMLRMGSSMWLQGSGDNADNDQGRNVKLEKQLNYRDGYYFSVINGRQWQIPISSYFHHDPCFGKAWSDGSTTDDKQFRMYLYMIAMRGSALWDMLYSASYLDVGNKWMINTEALNFAEDNFHILKNTHIIGTSPTSGGPYGFSAWDPTTKEGLIAVRNPKSTAQSMTVQLSKKNGTPVDVSGLYRTMVMEYESTQAAENVDQTFKFNDNITVNLGPGEVRIWKFSPTKDVTPATFVTASADSAANSVKVKFDEPITATAANFTVTGADNQTISVSKADVGADYKTVTLTLASAMTYDAKYTVSATGVKDRSNNATAAAVSPAFYCNKDGLIASVSTSDDLTTEKAVASENETIGNTTYTMLDFDKSYNLKSTKGISGKGDFYVKFLLKTTAAEGNLVSQNGQDINISLNGGKIQFTAGGLTATSDVTVNNGARHYIACTREKNGMLKIYIDSIINTSKYDATNVNANITEANIVVGSANVSLGYLTVANTAYDFDVLEETSSVGMPVYSTDGATYWYQLYTPNRSNYCVTSNGAGVGMTGVVNTSATQASQWKFVKRSDNSLDIINRKDGSYIAPTAAWKTQLSTSAAQPAAGWNIGSTNEDALFIITSGKVQLHQTNASNGWKIFNWSSGQTGQDQSDDGCLFAFKLMENTTVGITSATVADSNIKVIDGKVYATDGSTAIAYTLDGRSVTTITPGIYLIKVNGKTSKYIIK